MFLGTIKKRVNHSDDQNTIWKIRRMKIIVGKIEKDWRSRKNLKNTCIQIEMSERKLRTRKERSNSDENNKYDLVNQRHGFPETFCLST